MQVLRHNQLLLVCLVSWLIIWQSGIGSGTGMGVVARGHVVLLTVSLTVH